MRRRKPSSSIRGGRFSLPTSVHESGADMSGRLPEEHVVVGPSGLGDSIGEIERPDGSIESCKETPGGDTAAKFDLAGFLKHIAVLER
jgi:hypothetical protein